MTVDAPTRRLGAALLVASVLLLASCGSDGGSDDGSDGTGDGGGTATTAVELTSYDDIAALHQRLVDEGVECGLEYEGLRDDGREVSICVIEGEQALLTVWDDPSLVAEFAESEAAGGGEVAYGANWTVDLDSPETAALVAEALGGTVSG